MIQNMTMATAMQQQYQQPIVIHIRKAPPKRYDNYNGPRAKALGIGQIVCGCVAVLLNSLGLAFDEEASSKVNNYGNNYYAPDEGSVSSYGNYYWNDNSGMWSCAGFWVPVFLFISGGLAICSSRRPVKCMVVSNLVMAVIATVMAIVLLAMAILAMSEDAKRIRKGFTYTVTHSGYRNGTYYHIPDTYEYSSEAKRWADGMMVVSTLYMLNSIVCVVTTIMTCSVCGKVLCCAETENENSTVQYLPYGGNSQNTSNPTNYIVLDKYGRPIPEAHVIQLAPGGGYYPLPQITQGQQMDLTSATTAPQPTQQQPATHMIYVQPPAYQNDQASGIVSDAELPTTKPGSAEDSPPPPYN